MDSKVNEGSRFSFLVPLALPLEGVQGLPMSLGTPDNSSSGSICVRNRRSSQSSEINSLVEALNMAPISGNSSPKDVPRPFDSVLPLLHDSPSAIFDEHWPHARTDEYDVHVTITRQLQSPDSMIQPPVSHANINDVDATKLRILIVEV